MAKVAVKVLGGSLREVEAKTVADLKRQLSLSNYQANVNQSPATDDQELSDNDFVMLSPAAKGGC